MSGEDFENWKNNLKNRYGISEPVENDEDEHTLYDEEPE